MAINPATSGGVRAFPNLAAECVIPCAKARFPCPIHVDIARVAVGKADTPMPSITLPKIMPAMLLARPINIVAADQITANTVRATRAPTRSLIQPLRIWQAR